MNIIEKATIIHYHRHRISEFSPGTVKALGWKRSESQQKRFEVLATVGNLASCSILDIGCGYGDLKSYLDKRYSDYIYIGIDQVPEFITDARKRYKDSKNTHFYQADFSTAILPEADYVIASGALGYRCDNYDFYFEMIDKMYNAASKAVAFNMLDKNLFPEHELLVGHDRKRIEDFCGTLSSDIRIIMDYLDDDFTVFIFK